MGSHVLIGAAVGCALSEFFEVTRIFLYHGSMNNTGGLYLTEGTRQWISTFAFIASQAIIVGCSFFFGLFFLRTLLKHDWVAAILASLLGIWIEGGVASSPDWKTAVVYLVIYFLIFIAMLRFGLLATVAAVFFVNGLQQITLGLDWSTWYAPYGLAAFAFLLAIALAAFWRSLGAQKLLGDVGPAG